MSDLNKITEGRKAKRESASSPEWRQIMALEDIADSLEGIRQDLTTLPANLAAQLMKVIPTKL